MATDGISTELVFRVINPSQVAEKIAKNHRPG